MDTVVLNGVLDRYETAAGHELLPELRDKTLLDWVPVDKMFVDRYGRPPSLKKVQALAEGWDDRAVNTLVVSLRDEDGRFAILDGNHRRLAALDRGIVELPCRVCIDLTYEQEADLFNKLNTTFKPTALDRFRAKLEAGDPTTRSIAATVRALDLDIAIQGPGPGRIAAVLELERIYAERGAAILSETLAILNAAFGSDVRGYNQPALRGMASFWVRYRNTADRNRVIDQLRKTGATLMMQRTATMRGALGGQSALAWGRALHALYNQGLRLYKLDDWQDRAFSEAAKEAQRSRAQGIAKRLTPEQRQARGLKSWQTRRGQTAGAGRRT